MSAWGGGLPSGGQGFGNGGFNSHMMTPGTGPQLSQQDFAQQQAPQPPAPPPGGYQPFGGGGAQYNGVGQPSTFPAAAAPMTPTGGGYAQPGQSSPATSMINGGGDPMGYQAARPQQAAMPQQQPAMPPRPGPFGGGAQMPVRPTGPFGPTMQRPMGDAQQPQIMARPMGGQQQQYPPRQMGPPPSSILARMRSNAPSTGGPPPNGMSPREAVPGNRPEQSGGAGMGY